MPADKKKGKKGGKGKKGRKEPEITFQEALLAYRIGLVEKQLEDWRYEEKNLADQFDRLSERNEKLTEEQEQYITILMRQSKEFEKKNMNADKIGKDKVMEALAEKWEAAKQEEVSLEEFQLEILQLEKQISRAKRELKVWLNYKHSGYNSREHQIELLGKELRDMKESYADMGEHLSRDLDDSRQEIIDFMERTLNKQKHNASEKAMATLDKKDRQEVLDNDWMKEEVAHYEGQCVEMEQRVEVIERENLSLMSQLFECNIDDLKITRKMFLTQFEENETLAEGGILEVDLRNISLIDRIRKQGVEDSKLELSATDQVAFDDVEAMQYPHGNEEEYGEDYGGKPATPTSDDLDPFDNYFNFDDEDIDEYLELGPLELKMLSLSGEKKPVYVKGGTSKEEIKAQSYRPLQWPVTIPMLKSATTPPQPSNDVYA